MQSLLMASKKLSEVKEKELKTGLRSDISIQHLKMQIENYTQQNKKSKIKEGYITKYYIWEFNNIQIKLFLNSKLDDQDLPKNKSEYLVKIYYQDLENMKKYNDLLNKKR